jgi:hypothetical protein
VADFWTICHYHTPGHAIDIRGILEIMDQHLYGYDSIFPHTSETYTHIAPSNRGPPSTIHYLPDIAVPTVVPFLLYLLGAISSFCVLATFVGIFILKMKAKQLAEVPILSHWTATLALAIMSFSLLVCSIAHWSAKLRPQ